MHKRDVDAVESFESFESGESLESLESIESVGSSESAGVLARECERQHKAPGGAKRNPGFNTKKGELAYASDRPTSFLRLESLFSQTLDGPRHHGDTCICRSHSRACLAAVITPGSASLHPGLYAAARIRELRTYQTR